MAIKRRDIDRIYNAIRPRLNPKARTGAAVVGTLPAHTHSADQITSEEAGDIAATDVQDALAEVASEKLARDGSQTVTGDLDHDHHSLVNVHDADIEGTVTVGEEIVQTGPIGSATVQGTRKITMAGIGLIEAVLKLDFTGAGVGDGIIDQPRVIHMAGDDDDDEARIDGLERTVFNDEPTKSVIQNPSVVQFNPAVSAGVDTVHQEGQVGWDAVERTLVQDAEPAAYDSGTEHPRLSLGWAVINCINGSGDLIPPFKVVYVSGGIEDVGPGVNRPAVSPWDGMADSFGAQLGISQRVTGVTLHGSDDGEPVQVVRRGLVRGITDDNAEVWTVGDRLWADRTSPGRVTKVYDESGEYARIFVGTVIEDGAGEGPWSVDVDVRVLPTLGELSFMALASLADFYVPMFDVSLGWVPKQVDHNAHLASLQGGTTDEYYHLTEEAAAAGEAALVVEPNTGTKALDPGESGKLITNEGDLDGSIINLPAAAAGLRFGVICQVAQTITINAASGDTIRMGAAVSATGGLISTATVGNAVALLAINGTEWVAISYVGIVGLNWTVT